MGDENRVLDVQVRELSDNVRALSERLEQLQRGTVNSSFDANVTPSAEALRKLASQLQSNGHGAASSARMPFNFGPASDAVARSTRARNDGKFYGDAKWWNAGYARCEIFIDTDGGRRYFRGEGGGFPGAGAYSGDLYTGDLGRLLTTTATCQIVSAVFYVNITFWDAGSANLGMYHGGGFGAGGGLFAGHWTA